MSRPWFAAIAADSPRYAAWVELFGADVVAIESPEPFAGESPDGPGLFYKARVQDLADDVVDRLLGHFARFWGCPRREAIEDLYGEHGCPILADDVGVGPTPGQARAALAARAKGGEHHGQG